MDIPSEVVENFDCDAFENTKGKRWTNERRYHLILYLMKRNNLKSVYDLKVIHFTKLNYDRAFCTAKNRVSNEFNNNHVTMIQMILQEKDIVIDTSLFKMSIADRVNFLDNIPMGLPLTDEEYRNKIDTVVLISEIPSIMNDVIMNPLESSLEGINENEFMGIVYVAVVNETKQIIYCGSTTKYNNRKKNHNDCVKNDNDTVNNNNNARNFHKYIIENELQIGKSVTLLPICKTHIQFETLVEAEVYDYLKGVQSNNTSNIVLQNSVRPLHEKYNIDSNAILYEFYDTIENRSLYVGSTMDFFKRKAGHRLKCFQDKLSTKFYNYIRELVPGMTDFPKHIVIRPIEKCPIFLRYSREKSCIIDKDLIINGYNSCEVLVSNHEKDVRMKQYFKEYDYKNREKRRKQHKEYYENNKEKIKEYRETHKEDKKVYNHEWKMNNKERVKEYNKIYRQQFKDNMTDEQKEERKRKDKEKYHNMTDEQKEERRRKDREKYAEKLANMTEVEKEEFRAKNRARKQKG
tara:strand:+ start:349 stop:1905 length:1557 start_codon:yes stop_codon:yes gene_type:complete